MKRKRYYSLLFPLVVILLLSGCRSAKGPGFQPLESRPPDKAVIYIYRPLISRLRASDYHSPYLFVDNKKIVPMKVGRYTWLYAEPGTHVFEIKATTFFRHTAVKTLERISLEVEAGKEYYLGFEQNLETLNPVLTPWLSLIIVTDNPDNKDPLPTYRLFWSVPQEIAVRQLRKTVYLGLDPD
jgi:hypothetical protein